MYSLHEIRIKKVLPGPDACFVSAGFEDWHIELHFIVQADGQVRGRTNQNEWVPLTTETTGIVRKKIREYFIQESIVEKRF